jgi:GNAT superfamily N-acetyltransferase
MNRNSAGPLSGDAVSLRDGSQLLVRPIAPSDWAALEAAFERLGEESRRRRFLAPKRSLSPSELSRLTGVDHRDHEALVALDPAEEAIVGVARFVRSKDEPEVAEPAVAVVDDWQRRGLGTALLNRLADRARDEGLRRFRSTLLDENRQAIALLEQLGGVRSRRAARGVVEIEVELPEREGIGPQMARTLRAVAAGELRAELSLPFTAWMRRLRATLRARG